MWKFFLGIAGKWEMGSKYKKGLYLFVSSLGLKFKFIPKNLSNKYWEIASLSFCFSVLLESKLQLTDKIIFIILK